MNSIYDDLSARIGQGAARGPRDGARRDLGLLLFAEREKIRDLWMAAERRARIIGGEADTFDELRVAVEKLRPLFGERGN